MRLRLLGLVLLIFAVLQFLYGMNEFWDDSFIGMVYARNIARGVGPVFLPVSQDEVTSHAVVEGYSNPLWTFLTAAFYWLPGPVFFWVKLASFLSVGLLAFSVSGLFRDLVRRPGRPPVPAWVSVLPALLIVLNSSIFAYTKSGMETVTFTALVVSAVWHTWRSSQAPAPKSFLANAVLWFLVALTRPEGILYGAVAALFLSWRAFRGNELKKLVWWVFPLSALLAGFYLWRFSYYHEWLPNTFHAKVGIRTDGTPLAWLWLFMSGVQYAFRYFVTDVPVLMTVAALASLLWIRRLVEALALLLLLIVTSNFLFVILVGGDFWPLSRFLQIVSSIIVIFAVVPLAMVATGEQHRGSRTGWELSLGRNWSYVIAVVLVASQPLLPLLTVPQFYGELRVLSGARLKEAAMARHVTPQFLMGKWLNENLPRDAVVALDQAGQIPYYLDRQVVDVLGLNDRYLARNPLEYRYLRERGVTHLVAAVIQTNDKPDILYPQLLKEPGFTKDFSVSSLFEGEDQHHNRQTFVVFTRNDLLAEDQVKACLNQERRLASLPDMLQDVPRHRLDSRLVKDLSP